MSVIEVIESVCGDICDNYCKKPQEWAAKHDLEDLKYDEDYLKFLDEVCNHCPLEQLR